MIDSAPLRGNERRRGVPQKQKDDHDHQADGQHQFKFDILHEERMVVVRSVRIESFTAGEAKPEAAAEGYGCCLRRDDVGPGCRWILMMTAGWRSSSGLMLVLRAVHNFGTSER